MANRNNSQDSDIPRASRPLLRTLKRTYYRFLRLRGAPEQISLGIALGVFIGMTPFLGFHTVIAVMLAAVFKWSKIAAGVGVFITNPFTAPFIYPLTYKLGAKVAGFSKLNHFPKLFEPGGVIGLMKNSPMILVDLVVGGVIIGIPLAIISYYAALYVVSSARKRMEKRKAQRISRQAALTKRKNRLAAKKKQPGGNTSPEQ
jgi:uncharacterized protein (DUF2062 family)